VATIRGWRWLSGIGPTPEDAVRELAIALAAARETLEAPCPSP
jgi:hypothetical protein